jgi:hypothetical protein
VSAERDGAAVGGIGAVACAPAAAGGRGAVTAGRISGLWGLQDTWTRMSPLAGDNVTLGELGSLS